MPTRPAAHAPDPLQLRATLTVDGRRWRRLSSPEALAAAPPEARVFIVDPESGGVRFGDGAHGAQPPSGSRVMVGYRRGAGAGGEAATWAGQWPPHPFALASALVPCARTAPCG